MLPTLRSVAVARPLALPGRLLAVSKLPTLTSTWSTRTLATDSNVASPPPSSTSPPSVNSRAPPSGPFGISLSHTPSISTLDTPFSRTNHVYHVNRTTSNNLPVYEKRTSSTGRSWTQIRRVDGGMYGLKQLKADLEEHLMLGGVEEGAEGLEAVISEASTKPHTQPPPPRVRPPRQPRNMRGAKEKAPGQIEVKINPTTGHIIIPGRHKDVIIQFLLQKGF